MKQGRSSWKRKKKVDVGGREGAIFTILQRLENKKITPVALWKLTAQQIILDCSLHCRALNSPEILVLLTWSCMPSNCGKFTLLYHPGTSSLYWLQPFSSNILHNSVISSHETNQKIWYFHWFSIARIHLYLPIISLSGTHELLNEVTLLWCYSQHPKPASCLLHFSLLRLEDKILVAL